MGWGSIPSLQFQPLQLRNVAVASADFTKCVIASKMGLVDGWRLFVYILSKLLKHFCSFLLLLVIISVCWRWHLETSPASKVTLCACAKKTITSSLKNLDWELECTRLISFSFLFLSKMLKQKNSCQSRRVGSYTHYNRHSTCSKRYSPQENY